MFLLRSCGTAISAPDTPKMQSLTLLYLLAFSVLRVLSNDKKILFFFGGWVFCPKIHRYDAFPSMKKSSFPRWHVAGGGNLLCYTDRR